MWNFKLCSFCDLYTSISKYSQELHMSFREFPMGDPYVAVKEQSDSVQKLVVTISIFKGKFSSDLSKTYKSATKVWVPQTATP